MAARSGSGERTRRERPGARLQVQPQTGDRGLCRGCLSRTVPEAGIGLSLACPLCRRRCRRRSGSWIRVPAAGAGPLWQQQQPGRRRKQQPGRRRRRRRLGEEAEEDAAATGPDPEPVFRAPLVLSKAGDVREGLENQLRQYEPEKESLKEDDESVTAEIIQIILAEGEHEKQQMEKKKTIMEQVKRDEELARKWGQDFTALVSAGSLITNNVINVLSSSENSRSNSAPNLSSEKRPANDPVPSCPAKRERSASPDSNDSISGEFNHFKPISCSPCTPPKKLPDGRVMKPKIVKSTPRNLGCGFYKPAAATTTYDVNPNLLQKWGQILQERHEEMVASKGTLISEDEGEDAAGRLGEWSEIAGMELSSASCSPGLHKLECLDSLNSAGSMDYSESGTMPETYQEVSEGWSSHMELIPTQQATVEQGKGSPHNTSTSSSSHMGAKQSRGHISGSDSRSKHSSSHGKKRRHKTKHTAGSRTKRAKWNVNNGDIMSASSLDHNQQEEEDRRLAARLQRRLDAERTTVNRQKGSEDGYPLRTKANFKTK
ncbi:E3 ubiquitin-protein ligase RNF169 isoform X2 [Rhincodon typus]|uniref:E3 ubiquitin-protein ligase RNF169 isoform X2 n=1 Tax=Rhincodon typus TaxID=259920 RepID=UPI002030B229|nr:E3 ubiquitin-protein ligase RNF169 isoform X2 [Rhincodon typus]